MTTQLTDRVADDLIADSVDDAALAALLRTKPEDEEIPAAVWWLIAESLRPSVTIRRTLAADISPDREDLPILVAEARLLTEAALVESRFRTSHCGFETLITEGLQQVVECIRLEGPNRVLIVGGDEHCQRHLGSANRVNHP